MYTFAKALGIAQEGEEKKIYVTHLTIRESITILIFKIILIDILAAVVFLVSFPIMQNQGLAENLNAVFIVLVVLKILFTVYLVLSWVNEYYEITPTFIYYKRGILFRSVKKQDLVLIRVLKIKHGLLGRIFNFGTIELKDIRLNTEITLFMIHNPLKYLKILEELIPDLEEERKFFREKSLEEKQD